MIRLIIESAANFGSRLWSPDPETRARAWLSVLTAAAVVGIAVTIGADYADLWRACQDDCAPNAPQMVYGRCYCSANLETP